MKSMINNFFTSPLEQFLIYPIVPIRIGFLDISITNSFVISLIIFLITVIFALSLNYSNSYKVIPSYWQSAVELLYKMVLSLCKGNIPDVRGQYFFPLIFTLFFLIMSMNLIGLIPYSFTLTSHLIVTFAIALACFIGINIIGVEAYGSKSLVIFLPAGTSFVLSLLLVPIEIISYVFRPISLSIRLFANMMAGHTLLKVIAGFAFTLMSANGFLFFLHYIPLMILVPLFVLEFFVCLIQAYVFSVLMCIYITDVIQLYDNH